jgi:hypothetical protein
LNSFEQIRLSKTLQFKCHIHVPLVRLNNLSPPVRADGKSDHLIAPGLPPLLLQAS